MTIRRTRVAYRVEDAAFFPLPAAVLSTGEIRGSVTSAALLGVARRQGVIWQSEERAVRRLIGSRLQVQSELPLKEARDAIRTSTARVLSEDADSESCIGITIGNVVFVWRPSWQEAKFIPGPVFRGKLRKTGGGSLLSGHFTIPFFSLVAIFLCACFTMLLGFALSMDMPARLTNQIIIIISWIIFGLPLLLFARWMLRLPWANAERDQAFIERHLLRALETPESPGFPGDSDVPLED